MRHAAWLSTSLAAIFPIAGIAVAACGGHTVSIGSNSSQLSGVDPSLVGGSGGAVPACSSGAEHPNVCCQATAGAPASCGVYPGAPFQACATGYQTYPDPRTCCDLEDPSSCAPPPAPPPTPVPTPVCNSLCPPGWYAIQDGCCTTDANGAGECYGSASAGGTPPSGGGGGGYEIDAGAITCFDPGGPELGPDAGPVPTPVGCPPPAPGPVPPPSPPPCELACPPGWTQANGAPDVCCRDDGNGNFECFSQSVGPQGGPGPVPPEPGPTPTPLPADASLPSVVGCSGTATSIDGGPGQCECDGTGSDGSKYAVSCDDTTGSCTCSVNGASVGVLPPAPGACASALSQYNACGFPQ